MAEAIMIGAAVSGYSITARFSCARFPTRAASVIAKGKNFAVRAVVSPPGVPDIAMVDSL